MIRRNIAVVAMLAVAAVPGAASADGPGTTPLCTALPNTVGADVQVGDRHVHVPAISDGRLCVEVAPVVGEPGPASLTVYQFCGTPCFRVVVEEGDWAVASTRVRAYLTYEADGVAQYVPIVDLPISLGVHNATPVCVAVGNPIPVCPDNSLTLPIPVP